MSNVRNKEIGGNQYDVTLFTTSHSVRHLRRLVKVIGPSFATMFEGADALALDDTGPLTRAIMLLADNIDKEDIVTLMKDLLSNTKRNDVAINFDLDFMGNLSDLFHVLAFVVESNYGNFSELSGSKSP